MIALILLIVIAYVYYKQYKIDKKRAKEWEDYINKH